MQRIYKKPSELLLALKLSWWIIVISIVIRCVTLPRALRILTHTISPKRIMIRKGVAFDSSILRAVNITDRLLALNHLCFTPTCWKRSIIAYRLLASAGMPAQIVFGVSGKSKDGIDGHAWVEVNSVPVFEAVTPEYVPTFLYPSFDGKPDSKNIFDDSTQGSQFS